MAQPLWYIETRLTADGSPILAVDYADGSTAYVIKADADSSLCDSTGDYDPLPGQWLVCIEAPMLCDCYRLVAETKHEAMMLALDWSEGVLS